MSTIYLITIGTHDWDEYDGFVVIAEDEQQAMEIIIDSMYDYKRSNWYEYKDQITIDEIGTSDREPQIALGSFNAG